MASEDKRTDLRELHRRLEVQLRELCDLLEPRVEGGARALADVRHFAEYGEYGVAFETLVDRCITPIVEITLDHFEKAAAIGEPMGLRSAWVDLVACLGPTSLASLPDRLRTIAENQVESELATNPVRAEWLTRLRSLLHPAQ
jgi:hypothetical protein